MINFLSSTKRKVLNYITNDEYMDNCGLFTSPDTGYRVDKAHMWSADNGCFKRYNPQSIIRMLEKYQSWSDTCLFIVCPDVVGDAVQTTELFYEWHTLIKSYGYPAAYVLQDGVENVNIPYSLIDAVFIGGSTPFKYSQIVIDTVAEAKQRGLWVHQGRVSSRRRIIYSKSIGCDSFDGTHYQIVPEDIKNHLPFHQTKQLNLWSV